MSDKVVVANNQGQELATVTKQKFLEQWALSRVHETYKGCRDIATCLKSEAPTIAQINKNYGSAFTVAYLAGWIVNLREFVNVGKAMTDEQCTMTATMIAQEYANINIADINFIFRNAKLGKYGQFYDRLDGQMILSWFDAYFEERCNMAAEISIQEAHGMKGRDYDSPDRVNKLVSSLLKPAKK